MHALIPVMAQNSACRLKVYTPFADEAQLLEKKFDSLGGIRLHGILQSDGHTPSLVTADPKKAAEGVAVIGTFR